jgi:predicted O-methyltransferase YrrM
MSARILPLSPRLYDYVLSHTARETAMQRRLRAATQHERGAGMQIGADQGAFMQLLVRLTGAKNCLEIGTYTGYSALCVALAMPKGGRLVCCDVSEEWTAVARRFWNEAGVARRIDLRLAPALKTLDALLKQGRAGSFDFAFIDADKENYWRYFERCLKLVRKGGLIAIDNTLWYGRVVDRRNREADTLAIRAFNRRLHRDARVDHAMLAIGDGLTLARKR